MELLYYKVPRDFKNVFVVSGLPWVPETFLARFPVSVKPLFLTLEKSLVFLAASPLVVRPSA